MVWSQHAKLTSPDLSLSESTSFGKWMVSWNQTLVVSAPDASSKKGEYCRNIVSYCSKVVKLLDLVLSV